MHTSITRQETWRLDESNGWADGPTARIQQDTVLIDVDAVWTEEDGVTVTLDTHDEPIPADLVPEVCAQLRYLAALPAPTVAA